MTIEQSEDYKTNSLENICEMIAQNLETNPIQTPPLLPLDI